MHHVVVLKVIIIEKLEIDAIYLEQLVQCCAIKIGEITLGQLLRLDARTSQVADLAQLAPWQLAQQQGFQARLPYDELRVTLKCLRLADNTEIDAARRAETIDRGPVLVEASPRRMLLD